MRLRRFVPPKETPTCPELPLALRSGLVCEGVTGPLFPLPESATVSPGGAPPVEVDPEPGVADSGDLETDLTELLIEVGRAALAKGNVMVLIHVDEIQNINVLSFILAPLHVATDKNATSSTELISTAASTTKDSTTYYLSIYIAISAAYMVSIAVRMG